MILSIYYFAYLFVALIISYVFIVNVVSKYSKTKEKEVKLIEITNGIFAITYLLLLVLSVGIPEIMKNIGQLLLWAKVTISALNKWFLT